MSVSLSPRLQICRNLIYTGERVADIGCDHGYLGISLLKENIASFVIASDIRKMPLESAKKNAQRFGVKDKMAFFLSDGLESIPRDFDAMVCSGMGGDTMISILEKATWLKNEKYRMILQCQTRSHTLRKYLSDNGWHIQKEILVRDGKFLYSVMQVAFAPGSPLTPGQCYFPPALSDNSSVDLKAYYHFVVKGLQNTGKHQDNRTVLSEIYDIGRRLNLKEEDNG